MSTTSTRLVKSPVSFMDFITLCETIIKLYPTREAWDAIFHSRNIFAVFFADKLVEVINQRWLPKVNEYLNLSPLLGNNEQYETCISIKKEDIFLSRDENETCGLIDSGEDLFYFEFSESVGLSLSNKMYIFPMFDEYSFCVECDDDGLSTIKKDCISDVASFYAKDLLDEDYDFLSVAYSLWTDVCIAANYGDFPVCYSIFRSEIICSFLRWVREKEFSASNHLCQKCLTLIEQLKNCTTCVTTDIIQVRHYQTQQAWYLVFTETMNSSGVRIDSKFVYPQTFYQCLLLNVLLDELNMQYGFFMPLEKGGHL